MVEVSFRIRGMDCAEEIAALKRELIPLVGSEDCLVFDLLHGRLTVKSVPGDLSVETIVHAVARTGMAATPWESGGTGGVVLESWWGRHGRAAMCGGSGILLLVGYLLSAIRVGWLEALAGADESTSVGLPFVSVFFYAAATVAGGWFVVPKALLAGRRLRPDMNLLMTVAVIGAVVIGEWFEAATVAFLFALALVLESWSIGRVRRAIGALMDLSPTTARCLRPDGGTQEEPVAVVPVGTIVAVRPGERIPLDGIITKGSTSVNQAPITGESAPVFREPGDDVFAGSINNEGAFEFRVTKPAFDTTFARIIRMVEEAQRRRAPSEQWVERFARRYTPVMMLLALSVALAPPLLAGASWGPWVYQALVLLVIACPCALVISTPVSVVAGLTAAARSGVLIKGGAYLEVPARLRAIALDKTGTVTFGRPEVQRIVPLDNHTAQGLLARAASIEALSEHPIGKAIVRRAEHDGVAYFPADSYRALRGLGAEAMVDGRLFWIGSHRWLHERCPTHGDFHEQAVALEDAGHSVIVMGNEDHVCGLISVADAVRPTAAGAVSALKRCGIEHIVMLTGDNAGTARLAADAVGVDDCQAELLPEDKVNAVEGLVRQWRHVAMVGDGVNDAPAMAAATIGIAMGAAGSDAAIETADVALMSDDLMKLPWLVSHSRRTVRTIRQNIAFALAVKAAFVALALLGVATLWMAIAADMGASLLVTFNGLRLFANAQMPR